MKKIYFVFTIMIIMLLAACSPSHDQEKQNANMAVSDNERNETDLNESAKDTMITDKGEESSHAKETAKETEIKKDKKEAIGHTIVLDKQISGGKGHLYKVRVSGNPAEGSLRNLAMEIRQKDRKSDFIKIILLRSDNDHSGEFLAKALFANTSKGMKMMELDNLDDYKFFLKDK